MIIDDMTPSFWVALAGGLFTLGYLIIHQVMLRLVMLAGSFCYIVYYATAADEPLWGAIYGSILMITANLIGLAALLWRNAMWSLPHGHKDIFPLFGPMRPGDFRALMALGERYRAKDKHQITTFHMEGPLFAGEVAYLLNGDSSATTIVLEGAEIIRWNRQTLDSTGRDDLKRPRHQSQLRSGACTFPLIHRALSTSSCDRPPQAPHPIHAAQPHRQVPPSFDPSQS